MVHLLCVCLYSKKYLLCNTIPTVCYCNLVVIVHLHNSMPVISVIMLVVISMPVISLIMLVIISMSVISIIK